MTVSRETLPRRFTLQRTVDVSGVSGTGVVAHGVVFEDGAVALRWRGEHASMVMWPNLASMEAVHGHDGATKVVWIDRATEATVAGIAKSERERAEHALEHGVDTQVDRNLLRMAGRAAGPIVMEGVEPSAPIVSRETVIGPGGGVTLSIDGAERTLDAAAVVAAARGQLRFLGGQRQ